MTTLIKQTTIEDRVYGKHERDIRALKLRMLSGGDFIRFDFDNESHGVGGSGGGLSVTTTTDSGDANVGINFIDVNDDWTGGALTTQVLINSINQGIQILQTTPSGTHPTGGLDVDVLGSITLISEDQSITILATASGRNVDIECDTNLNLYAANGPVFIQGGGLAGGKSDIRLALLPTVNPGGSGRLWNNGGVVNIT